MENSINELAVNTKTVFDYFLEHQFRNDIFIYCGRDALSFQKLHVKSSHLANKLKEKGIGKNMAIPVLLPTSVDLVVSVLALFKLGAAYVPIDINFPIERVLTILEDLEVNIVITSKNNVPKDLPDCISTIYVNETEETGQTMLSDHYFDKPSLNDLAYVIYTSGSTGKPKGVLLEHRQLVEYCSCIFDRLNLEECKSFAVLGTLAADAGNTALFCALIFGKNILLCDIRKQRNFTHLKTELKRRRVDCYKITPTLLEFFSSDNSFSDLLPKKCLIIGGENIPFELAEKTFFNLPKGCSMYNHYGPTETTIGVTTYKFSKDSFKDNIISIGHPLSTTKLFVRGLEPNDQNQEVDFGELLIGGAQVCRGYHKRSKLNFQKFIFLNIKGKNIRFYCSGDLVKRYDDGRIQYLGRLDNQIKINGNRIEIGEIESAILRTNVVKKCYVLPDENFKGRKAIRAYIVKKKGFQMNTFLETIGKLLPAYMIPNNIVSLDKIPLTSNNKIDLASLKKMESIQVRSIDENLMAQSATEIKLIDLWILVLEINKIGVEDNFFSLGGNSLSLIKLAFLINSEFRLELNSVDLFTHLTLSSMAQLIDTTVQTGVKVICNILNEQVEGEATESQKILFYQNRFNRNIPFPVTAITLDIIGEVDINRLFRSGQFILQAEPELRKYFFSKNGVVFYRIGEKLNLHCQIIHCDSNNVNSEVAKYTNSFDVSQPPLIRLTILVLPNGKKMLHIEISHLIADGESLGIFVDKLCTVYGRNLDGYSYANKISVKPRMPTNNFRKVDEEFWVANIVHHACFNGVLNNNKNLDGYNVLCDVSKLILGDQATSFLEEVGISRFQFLISVFAITISQITGETKFPILFPVNNRNSNEQMEMLGLFSNMVYLPVSIDLSMTVFNFLQSTSNLISEVLIHSRYPFELISKNLLKQRTDRGNPFLYFFGYQFVKEHFKIGGALLEPLVTTRTKENLALSFSLFDKGNKIKGRLASNCSYYSEKELEGIFNKYKEISHKMMSSIQNETIEFLFKI